MRNVHDFLFPVFLALNAFKSVWEVTHDLLYLVEYPTVYTARCVLLTSASLYPLVLLVISRMHSNVNTTVVIADPVTVHFTNTQPFSIFCFAELPCFRDYPRAKRLRYLPDLTSAPTSRAFVGINSSLQRHPADFAVQYVYRFLPILPQVKRRRYPLCSLYK